MNTKNAAFARLELAAILFALALLAMVALPVLASTKPRSDRVTCVNNLRLVGRAEQVWANDHGDTLPWRVDISEGGTQHSSLQNNAWFNYGMMSNEFATATILACPSDPTVKVARNFSNSSVDGFFAGKYRNNALSYFIGLDSFLTGAPGRSFLTGALGGDRNLAVDVVGVTCSSGVTLAAGVFSRSSRTQWTNLVHGMVGNILSVDGRVTQSSNVRVLRAILEQEFFDDNASVHLLIPR